jgi:hypothetical protein
MCDTASTKIDCPETPKYKSTKTGTKYFALIGTGINIKANSA